MPQGSILDPLIFNIFINDIFFPIEKSEVCNFADDDTFSCVEKKLNLVFFNLSSDLSNVIDWFKINSLKANPWKFQFRDLGANKNDCFNLNVAGKVIPSSSEVKLHGITFDYGLKFKKHINELIRKASYNFHALQKISRYLSVNKARLVANAFMDSQFNTAPSIWMLDLSIHQRHLHYLAIEVFKSIMHLNP